MANRVFARITHTALLSASLLLTGCEVIEYHPYDTRISGETDLNRRNMERIEAECLGRDTIRFAAIKKVFDSDQPVVVKDLCAHYGYPYSKYYGYLTSLRPNEDTFVNILNPHRKR